LINRYFGTVYVIPYGVQVREAVDKFEGQIVFRAFGLDNTKTYTEVLQVMHGPEILADLGELGERFWFAQGYEQLQECEVSLFANRAVTLPIGVPDSFWDTADSYTGADKHILFVCPNCVTNPYYAEVYRTFKRDFGDLPHFIIGAQDVPVDDPACWALSPTPARPALSRLRGAVLPLHRAERACRQWKRRQRHAGGVFRRLVAGPDDAGDNARPGRYLGCGT
jgi:hypothetical protein